MNGAATKTSIFGWGLIRPGLGWSLTGKPVSSWIRSTSPMLLSQSPAVGVSVTGDGMSAIQERLDVRRPHHDSSREAESPDQKGMEVVMDMPSARLASCIRSRRP